MQNTCLPTIGKLRNEANISQLQERVYQKMTPFVDKLNICIIRSRTADDADECFRRWDSDW